MYAYLLCDYRGEKIENQIVSYNWSKQKINICHPLQLLIVESSNLSEGTAF